MAILVAVGALSYFDFLKADRYASPTCNTGAQIQCVQSIVEGGEFKIHLRNNYPVDVEITEFNVRMQGDSGSWNSWTNMGSTLTIPRGQDDATIRVPMASYSDGSKINMDLEISFKRSGGTKEYTTLGTSTVKVLS